MSVKLGLFVGGGNQWERGGKKGLIMTEVLKNTCMKTE
jgi:hypothetical protein